MVRRKTTEEWIKKAKMMHGDRYDYSKIEYVDAKTKVVIVCSEHGEFEQRPRAHIKGQGCSKCAGNSNLDNDKFIQQAIKIHDNAYSYTKTNYKNNKVKVIITCPIHGDFEQTPSKHINAKQGCPRCGKLSMSISQSSNIEDFISKAKVVHNDLYKYDKANYTNSKTKVLITCPEHGDFEQTPNNHLQGQGCPSCPNTGGGFDPNKPAYLYYLKVTTNDNQILYKIGITNRTVNERFNLTDLSKIEIVKQKLYENGVEALDWETKLKRLYKQYQYKGPDILSSGNTELFTEDIVTMYYKDNNF